MWLWTSRWWERTFRVEGDLDTDKVLRSLWNEPSVKVAESCLMRQFGLVHIAARTKGRTDWRSEIEGIVIELTRCTWNCLMYNRRCYWSPAASICRCWLMKRNLEGSFQFRNPVCLQDACSILHYLHLRASQRIEGEKHQDQEWHDKKEGWWW